MDEKEYIERESLIKVCKRIIHDRWNDTTAPVSWSHAYADFIDDINNQPTADVAPVRHGRWLSWEEMFPDKTPKHKNNLGVFCSKCKLHNDNRNKYCPNCGAKMDETS